jgi:hypothetical protein
MNDDQYKRLDNNLGCLFILLIIILFAVLDK